MIKKYNWNRFMIIAIGLLSISILTGCGKKDDVTVIQHNPSPKETVSETNNTPSSTPVMEEVTDKQVELSMLIGLIGLTLDEMNGEVGESPLSIDEGGVEYPSTGIRAWFDDQKTVSQVYIDRREADFNGTKVGDSISKFKEVFGDPIKEENGEAHFQYEDHYLIVYYDLDTSFTVSVYVMNEDF